MLDYATALKRAVEAAKARHREMVVFLEPGGESWQWTDAQNDEYIDWQAERTYISAQGKIERGQRRGLE